ncbi:branched-chain amino acid ABC transporter permease [Eoetvoesiella caeni]|uniref:Amino acid/amide ABC transporter membrane protein 2 (HAAT family) n=1 Tax=Eoetvoesiella caeni TaxID=645616 RepID=A0A366GY21_9BURK|nr:branched-chain amino acid ABC transporter permease [Eoetvoesiella caeni]MCI2811257.1 branched-chain amino acid ABC transporter permease [Eoetvoesiella caeni]NYT57134.1 branched-chain amino acid ABC transporter permease [Eoetvoesiella caeni]RBP33646.1 amino acid/amide ABC transporter membrane protein 2 (HAAT family) [Eoetvoesiella caeni]
MSQVQHSLQAGRRWKFWEPLLWVLPIAVLALFPSQAFLLNQMAVMALFGISLDLILGYTGIMSLGHAAFFGLGGFAAALFAKYINPDPLLGLAVALAICAFAGAICSLTIIRGSELTVVMVTLGVSLIFMDLANYMTWLTGGADGLQGVIMGPVLGVFEFDLYGMTAAYYALAVLFVFFLLARRLVNSPFGFGLKAIRDNRLRASAIGIHTSSRIIIAYTISAAVAGVAGAVLAQSMAFASLDIFAFERSADVLLMVVIGGIGWLYGGVVGAVVFSGLHHVLSDLTPQYWMFWLGIFLVALMRVGRERFIRPWTWFRRSSS